MQNILVPIFVCVVLPVMIVWFVMRAKQNETNKKTDIMMKAIESGATIDTDFFKATSQQKTLKEKLLSRLTGACITGLIGVACLAFGLLVGDLGGAELLSTLVGSILLAIGIALFAVYLVGKRMLAKEIEAEEKALTEPKQ